MSEPLFREILNAKALPTEHPPHFHHPHKAALFELAYPDRKAAPATIEVTRWGPSVPSQVHLPATLSTEVRPDFYDYRPLSNGGVECVEWHVNFADPRLFAAYGSGLLAQDEMQVVEHPLLACVREALLAKGLPAKTTEFVGPTPVLVKNVERCLEISTDINASEGRPFGLYGNRFAAAKIDVIRKAVRRVSPLAFSNIIAMAAPAGGHGEYSESEIVHIFVTAYTAFAAAWQESSNPNELKTVIHTGFWGCGAFGGNRRLMIALQSLAARAAGISHLVLHAGNSAEVEDAQVGVTIADSIALRCGTPCTLDTMAGRVAMLGYRWGVSDGN